MKNAEQNPRKQSWYQRAKHTPLRDVLRGRGLTARLDWKGVIARSELPEGLQQLVLQVVKRSKLWRHERAQVAQEMIAHFEDGLELGRDAAELQESFGDPKIAAKLIRKATRRKRPLWWHVNRWGWRSVGAMVMLYAVWGTYIYHANRPSTESTFLEPYKAEMAAVAEEDKAWPQTRDALMNLGYGNRPYVANEMKTFVQIHQAYQEAMYVPEQSRLSPEEAEVLLLEKWQIHQDDFESIRRASKAKRNGFIPYFEASELNPNDCRYFYGEVIADESHDLLSGRLSEGHLKQMYFYANVAGWAYRDAKEALAVDFKLQVESGCLNKALEDVEAILKVQHLASDSPLSLDSYIGWYLPYDFHRYLYAAIASEQLSDAFMASLQELFINELNLGWQFSVHAQYCEMLDVVDHLYTDNGDGTGRLHPKRFLHFVGDDFGYLPNTYHGEEQLFGLSPTLSAPLYASYRSGLRAIAPAIASQAMSREDVVARIEAWYIAAQQWESKPAWEIGIKESEMQYEIFGEHLQHGDGFWGRSGNALQCLTDPVFLWTARDMEHLKAVQVRHVTVYSQLIAILAVERYKLKHGVYPKAVSDITADYTPRWPIDQMDGAPLRYRLVDGVPSIYSVGVDLDDDGAQEKDARLSRLSTWISPGMRQRNLAADPSWQPEDGDWVLYPLDE